MLWCERGIEIERNLGWRVREREMWVSDWSIEKGFRRGRGVQEKSLNCLRKKGRETIYVAMSVVNSCLKTAIVDIVYR